ncbi:sugar-binding transcriptional regulator [Mangrovicoccus algicola]|uniref:Sugar-binding transcriptional regulator n=1 Tax=Mangrovicoccus algicola TaxID=2771008 RepID=A0A8J6YZZ0_9RHOB|nr:sugar-binding transcriptional regulator [Mangrovicoccus algicola]MBE3639889.1 sugar-binding transcriptional regulator [Mangrovicoccus algicola]
MRPADRKLDDAARAAWLAYIGGMKQDEIAALMGISRQSAQRLVSQAMAAGLVKVRIDHPVARCLELAEAMRQRYGLTLCEVVPSLGGQAGTGQGVAHATAAILESWLLRETPVVIGLGTGRTLRAAVEQLPHIDCAHHKIVSLTGNISPSGSTAFYNVLFTISDKVSAPTYPLPLPVIAATRQERDLLLGQATLSANRDLARRTDIRFVGIGQILENPPLVLDGFLTGEDQARLAARGAIGEITGWVYDRDGRLVEDETNGRVSSAPLEPAPGAPVIACAWGPGKVEAIRGALTGRFANGLVTDEDTAEALL